MADQKQTDQNQDNDRGNEKAMGASVTGGAQGQQPGQGRNPQTSESAGQGGGVQGTGQRQPSQGMTDPGTKGAQGGSRLEEEEGQRNRAGQGGRQSDGEF
jgi:hypothetical protein